MEIYCPECGWRPPEYHEPYTKRSEIDPAPGGVRGWLTLLCVTLTIIQPFIWFSTYMYGLALGYGEMSDRYTITFLIDAWLGLAVAIAGCTAGAALWNVRPGAVASFTIRSNYLHKSRRVLATYGPLDDGGASLHDC